METREKRDPKMAICGREHDDNPLLNWRRSILRQTYIQLYISRRSFSAASSGVGSASTMRNVGTIDARGTANGEHHRNHLRLHQRFSHLLICRVPAWRTWYTWGLHVRAIIPILIYINSVSFLRINPWAFHNEEWSPIYIQYDISHQNPSELYLVGGFNPPLWKMMEWVRQLGWLDIPN